MHGRLQAVISAAVSDTLPRAREVEALLDNVAAVLRQPAGTSTPAEDGDTVAAEIDDAISARFRDRMDHFGTFNIVVFGPHGRR